MSTFSPATLPRFPEQTDDELSDDAEKMRKTGCNRPVKR
jgi:hypothetical protein